MVKIRLQRVGGKKAPFYHIVVADSRRANSGKIIEKIDYFKFFIVAGLFLILMSVGVHFMVKDAPDLLPNRDPKGFWHQVFAVFDFSLLKNNKLMRDVCIIFAVYFIGFQMYFSHLTNLTDSQQRQSA